MVYFFAYEFWLFCVQMQVMDQSKQTPEERRLLRVEQRSLRAKVIEQESVSLLLLLSLLYVFARSKYASHMILNLSLVGRLEILYFQPYFSPPAHDFLICLEEKRTRQRKLELIDFLLIARVSSRRTSIISGKKFWSVSPPLVSAQKNVNLHTKT